MADSKNTLRSLLSLSLLGATALGLYNVYSDNSDVKELAQRTACADRPCVPKILNISRSPIAQTFTIQTDLVEKGKPARGASVDVNCRRAAYLFGAYSCEAQGVLP